MNIPDDIKYTDSHEWIRVEGKEAFVGISEYATSQLGDIVFLEIETEGEDLEKGDAYGTIEAVKTVSDTYMPIAGKVVEVNNEAIEDPSIVNKDPYGQGWLIKIEIADESEIDDLMDSAAYKEIID